MRIVVPVKPLSLAKTRLEPVLSGIQRAKVMCILLDRVISAARELAPTSVVTADAVVAMRARGLGAEVIDEGEVTGLNAAVRLGADHAGARGNTRVVIVAADLPDVTAVALREMSTRAREGSVVICPSRDGGTNALILRPRPDFRFGYGPDSFARHCGEAKRLGLEIVVHESSALGVDIDWPEDLSGHPDLWAA
jgi:2-phospho-L-lactate guanylyltransferase